MTTFCLAVWLVAAPGDPVRYARPDLLIEPGELKKPVVARRFVILDVRGKDAYEAGHVPGAVRVEAAQWAGLFGDGKDAPGWAKRIGALGIDAGQPVVVYDDDRSRTAARVWWILRYWGIKDVRLLHAGWPGWKAAGGPVEKGTNVLKPRTAKLMPQLDRLATREQIHEGLKKGGFGAILDTRSKAEHCGDVALAKRGGAIPGAKHLEWTQVLDGKTGRFKTAAELTKLLQEAGYDPDRQVTCY